MKNTKKIFFIIVLVILFITIFFFCFKNNKQKNTLKVLNTKNESIVLESLKFEDEKIGLNLAFTGAIKDEIMDTEILSMKLLEKLIELLMKISCAHLFDLCGDHLEFSALRIEINTAENLDLHTDLRFDLKL